MKNIEEKRILVIDDNPDALDMIKDALDFFGFQVMAMPDTKNIFDHIKAFNPNLILIDYLLEGTNGGEACYQIKVHPETCHLPVVIMSAYPKVFFSLGDYSCTAFLPKPFGIDDLSSVIFGCLQQRQRYMA